MKRNSKHLISSKDEKRAIYIDEENIKEIIAYLNKDDRHRKKFKFISDIILGGHKNPDVYDKEAINNNCKDITAMKFFKGQENDRIYCKEIHTDKGVFIVIMAILYERKKTTKLNREQKNLIEKIADYTYEI
jgi:hypothetical protein